MYELARTDEQIDTLITRTCDEPAQGYKSTKFSGMTYEDGIRAALDWVLGNSDEDIYE